MITIGVGFLNVFLHAKLLIENSSTLHGVKNIC
ncbi:MAG: hypothetical protein K0S47_3111 [Herbinix sp.]|jgi:hypothetical protein|nr:hypothetical protein [Herbinix sp.]